jgi:hypothetical protein
MIFVRLQYCLEKCSTEILRGENNYMYESDGNIVLSGVAGCLMMLAVARIYVYHQNVG